MFILKYTKFECSYFENKIHTNLTTALEPPLYQRVRRTCISKIKAIPESSLHANYTDTTVTISRGFLGLFIRPFRVNDRGVSRFVCTLIKGKV